MKTQKRSTKRVVKRIKIDPEKFNKNFRKVEKSTGINSCYEVKIPASKSKPKQSIMCMDIKAEYKGYQLSGVNYKKREKYKLEYDLMDDLPRKDAKIIANKIRWLDQLEKCKGRLFEASTILNENTFNHYKYMENDPEYRKAVWAIKEGVVDYVEKQLHSAIEGMSDTAIIFYLKCKAKDRGYIDKQEINLTGGTSLPPIDISIVASAVNIALQSEKLKLASTLNDNINKVSDGEEPDYPPENIAENDLKSTIDSDIDTNDSMNDNKVIDGTN